MKRNADQETIMQIACDPENSEHFGWLTAVTSTGRILRTKIVDGAVQGWYEVKVWDN